MCIRDRCYAMIRNYKATIVRRLPVCKPVVFCGGVTCKAGVIRAIRDVFGPVSYTHLISEEEIQKYIDQLKTLGYAEEASASCAYSGRKFGRYDIPGYSYSERGGFDSCRRYAHFRNLTEAFGNKERNAIDVYKRQALMLPSTINATRSQSSVASCML